MQGTPRPSRAYLSCSWQHLRPRQCHLTQRRQVDLCVDRRGIQALMSEKVRNLLEAGAASYQATGHRVTKHVGALQRCLDSGAAKGTGRDLRSRVTGERLAAATPEVLDEDPALGSRRTTLAQVAGDGATGFARQRQHRAAACLACSQPKRSAAPIEVLQMQFCELTGP